MTNYEKKQCIEIEKWKKEEPGVVSKVTGKLFQPVSWLVRQIIPEKTFQSAIESANSISKTLIGIEDFKKEANISKIEDMKNKDLQFCDELADEIHNWAIRYAMTEGAAAGAGGVFTIALDIPFIITLAFRTINKIGLCYGFEEKTETDKQRVLQILSVAGANTMKEKTISLVTLRALEVTIAKTTWKKIAQTGASNRFSKEAAILSIKSLAKQLGVNINKRKALQVVPVVGAGVGALMNRQFITDIAWVARRTFQEAWLNEKYQTIEF
ncbi:EcsC family protein [Flavobacterium oreochromis]|uniref:EcsC family protein n=1 Tax=Flavobacterium oreochromis TaxID=2906078 RepID=UPI00385AF49F